MMRDEYDFSLSVRRACANSFAERTTTIVSESDVAADVKPAEEVTEIRRQSTLAKHAGPAAPRGDSLAE